MSGVWLYENLHTYTSAWHLPASQLGADAADVHHLFAQLFQRGDQRFLFDAFQAKGEKDVRRIAISRSVRGGTNSDAMWRIALFIELFTTCC